MTNELLSLIVAHIACADMAETRHLSMAEVQYCSTIYQEIKLGFVPGVDMRTYRQLSTEDQFAINQQGYLAFRSWRIDNPGTVRHLERVARGDVELGQAS